MDQQRRKVYETTFILNATLDDAQIDQIVDKFKDFVVKQSGEFKLLEKWGRKRLTYPIQKKNNGFYVVGEFTAPSDMIAKLERYYALDENILRFLTVQLSEKALKARDQQKKLTEKDELAAAEAKIAVKPTPGEPEAKAPEIRK